MNEREQKKDTEGLLVQMAKQCGEDSEKWFGDFPGKYSIPHHTLAMCGEVGEFANIVKKIERGSLDIRTPKVRYDLAMELTDVFVYLLNLANLLHVDLEQTYMIVRANNEKRFSAERDGREAARRNGSH
jgi:NTP pyrophosphatase (non-canonical NTP hydrolase)